MTRRKEVVVGISDMKAHGVVDGAHTLHAILDLQNNPIENQQLANVFLKVFVDVDPEQIAEIAGGLNTSQQVDLTSLENLRDHFSELQRVIADESYSEKIAYKMNEAKDVDVREILYYLAVFDCDEIHADEASCCTLRSKGRHRSAIRRASREKRCRGLVPHTHIQGSRDSSAPR